MAFASVEDVNRILGYTTGEDLARDASLRAKLMAVESWALQQGWRLSDRGPQVASFYDVPEDATLHLPASDVVVTKVRVFSTPFYESARDLVLGMASPGYEVLDDGAIALRPSFWVHVFDGAYGSRVMRTHHRVDVHYVGTGIVPPAVTEGIALLAAGYWLTGETALRDIKSEKIGDYSYTLGGGSGDVGKDEPNFVSRAKEFLSPFMPKSHVRVT